MTLSIRTLLYDVLLLLELGLFFLFFAPLFLRIFNAGNLFGMAVSAICFLLTLFHRPFGQLLSRIWGNLCGKCVLSILALLLTAGIAFAGFCSVKMVQYYQNSPQTPCTVVVLGCKVKGTVPSLMLQRRLEAAKDYLQQHPDIPCIVSGGKGTGEDISEAQAMKTYLTAAGIAADRILMEDRSTDTHENRFWSNKGCPTGLPFSRMVFINTVPIAWRQNWGWKAGRSAGKPDAFSSRLTGYGNGWHYSSNFSAWRKNSYIFMRFILGIW